VRDVDAGQDDHASADPAVVADHDRMTILALSIDMNARVIESVVLGEDLDPRPEEDVGTYVDATLAPEEAMIADAGPVAHADTDAGPGDYSGPNECGTPLDRDVATEVQALQRQPVKHYPVSEHKRRARGDVTPMAHDDAGTDEGGTCGSPKTASHEFSTNRFPRASSQDFGQVSSR
jgi:hypothetical protein